MIDTLIEYTYNCQASSFNLKSDYPVRAWVTAMSLATFRMEVLQRVIISITSQTKALAVVSAGNICLTDSVGMLEYRNTHKASHSQLEHILSQ